MQEALARLAEYEKAHPEEVEQGKIDRWRLTGTYSRLKDQVNCLIYLLCKINGKQINNIEDANALRALIATYKDDLNRFQREVTNEVYEELRATGFRSIFGASRFYAEKKLKEVEPTWGEFL